MKSIEKIEISNQIAEVVSRDTSKAARETAYYKNFKDRKYSVFDSLPEEVHNLQAVNCLAIGEIPNSSLIIIDFDKYQSETKDINVISDKSISEAESRQKRPHEPLRDANGNVIVTPGRPRALGNIETLKTVYAELVFLLRLKKDIDYENTTYKGYSSLVKWILKRISQFPKPKDGVFHAVLTPEDHKFLSIETNMNSNKIVYKMLVQLIAVLGFHYHCIYAGHIHTNLKKIIEGEVKYIQLAKNVSDIKDIEPLYQWNSITSIKEREWIVNRLGRNVFHEQNKLLDFYRRGKTEVPSDWKKPGPSTVASSSTVILDVVKELRDINSFMKNTLPQGVYSVVYGRLRKYHDFRKKNPTAFPKNPKTGALGNISYQDFLKKADDELSMDLFAEENVLAITLGLVNRSTQISDLTKLIHFNKHTLNFYYNASEVRNCITYVTWADKATLENNNPEKVFLDYVESKTIDRNRHLGTG
jgi:hypothetical protein